MIRVLNSRWIFTLAGALLFAVIVRAGEGTRVYENRLTAIKDPKPILADFPDFVEPIHEIARFEAPTLIDDPEADLTVRSWRFSYNARGIIEIPNRLRSDRTAIVVVHPWGVDDGQGWHTPEPAGAAFQCTPAKNKIVLDHGAKVIDPFLKSLRGKVSTVVYSLPGQEDPIRKQIYRSVRDRPTAAQRIEGKLALETTLRAFNYQGGSLPTTIAVSPDTPTIDYLKTFPGLDASDKYDPKGFWTLPIPIMKQIAVAPDDVVIYDAEGYALLRDYLKKQGVRHVLLAGYNTDMCVCSTTAGYKNLQADFDVFLVGDATIATFPAHPTPRFATTSSVAFASLNLLITQVSWIRPLATGK
jgi:hypothetical protein